MEKEIRVSAEVSLIDEFEFGMYHTYTSFAGYTGILISICAVVAFFNTFGKVDTFTSVILLFCGILFLVVKPISLFFHAKKKVEQEKELGPILYRFGADEFVASQKERSMTVAYNSLYKVREYRHAILVYTEKHHAMILPKASLGNQIDQIREIFRKKAKNASVRVKND